MSDRRGMLVGSATAALIPAPAFAGGDADADRAAIAAQYDRSAGAIRLEHGNRGAMARPVHAARREAAARVDRDTSYHARRGMGPDLLAARAAVADELGVSPDSIAFTRNATGALKAPILGCNRLTPGDTVLYAGLDDGSMQACVESLRRRQCTNQGRDPITARRRVLGRWRQLKGSWRRVCHGGWRHGERL